jgi:hypothetical protein
VLVAAKLAGGLPCAAAQCWLAGLMPSEALAAGGWPHEPWRSLAESAAVRLLVDPLLRGSLVARVVVTDSSVQVKVKVTLQPKVCLSWCRAPSGAYDQIFLLV